MPRIKPLERGDARWSIRWIYGLAKRKFGKELTPLKVQARIPDILWASSLMSRFLDRKHYFLHRLKSLVHLRTAARIGCPF
ncbi:MAG TPA: hypothetical protein VHA33_28220 [Candidatus Angelobacter sp.]|nr:hypothetical protein [Candidatus Angelobacter sp.]